MAGTLKVDSINADSNLALRIANTAVAYIDSTGLTIVGNSLNVGGGRIVVTSNNSISTPTVIGANLVTSTGTTALGITANGQITTANAPFILTGGGITFPATQSASSNANTLDDYEEGTWTPTITPFSGSLTSYTSSGTYIKVGKLVSISFIVNVINAGTSSVVMQVSNLPFNTTGTNTSAGVMRENAVAGICGSLVAASSTVLYGAKYDGGNPLVTTFLWVCQYTYQATA